MTAVRQPAVAGSFYPASPVTLEREVARLVDAAYAALPPDLEPAPKAVIAPHAGYVYSGSTAALAYARLVDARERIRRVVLLGPCHRVAVHGLALSGADAWLTPLGRVAVAEDEAARLALPQVGTSPEAHAWEHSLEVHVPFLQHVLEPGWELVPLAVGRASATEVAEAVEALWGGPETLVVVSSDLSHYHPHEEAIALDTATCERIVDLDPSLPHDRACGATPLNGLLLAATHRSLRPHLYGRCTSGDTAGDRDRVVGYASVGFTEPADGT